MSTRNKFVGKTCLSIALTAVLAFPSWAERLDPARSVLGENEDIHVSTHFPQTKTGDLYVAADVAGTIYFLNELNQWVTTPTPYETGQTYSGTKQINLGNTSGIGPGVYSVLQIITLPNTSNIFDIRNWIGGFNGFGQTSFQVKLPSQITGDQDNDGWADDDSNHDGFHDDDSNRDGQHDDDLNHDGFHDDDSNHDGHHDDDLNHDGFHDDDLNHDGFHDDDSNRDGFHDDDSNHDGLHDDNSSHGGSGKKQPD